MTFHAVAHESSFSRAARRLHLSQPSVSNQIALLETEVGHTLFDRSRGGLRLTPAGDILLTHANAIAGRYAMATAQLSELTDATREHFRLGSFPTALAGYVPRAMARLRSAHPAVRISVDEVTPSTVEARLLAGAFHLALSYQDARADRRDFGDAQRIDLLQETFLIALPPGHSLAGQERVDLAELRHENWILPSPDGFIARACRQAGFEPHVISITREQLATRALIEQGLAVALVPSLLDEAFGNLVLRPLDGPIPSRDVFALVPPGDRHPLVDEAIQALARD